MNLRCFGLADVTQVLCSLELNIQRVKVSTTPDGTVVDLFFITDTRFSLCVMFVSQDQLLQNNMYLPSIQTTYVYV